jgi:hypothetical protein
MWVVLGNEADNNEHDDKNLVEDEDTPDPWRVDTGHHLHPSAVVSRRQMALAGGDTDTWHDRHLLPIPRQILN